MNRLSKFPQNNRWLLASTVTLAAIIGAGYFFKVIDAHKHTDESLISFSLADLKNRKNLIDVLVLGSGAAGSSAAVYATRNGYQTVILHGPEPGGQLTKTTWVENIPGIKKILGQHAIADIQSQAKSFGAEYVQDTATSIDTNQWPYAVTTEEGNTFHALTIIAATGASPRKLEVEGEEEYWGRGVTTCAICDAPFYKGKKVVVVGGGDSAAEEALQLAGYATSVTILVRKEEMRASCIMRERLAAVPTISIMYNVQIQKVMGNDVEVTSIELLNNKTDEVSVFNTDGVFLAIGHDPNTDIFKGVLDLDKQGYIEMRGRSQMTSMPGIFAAGDVEDKNYRQAVVAEGRGAIAALDAGAFLREIGFNKQISRELERRGAYFENKLEAKTELRKFGSIRDFDQEVIESPGVYLLDFYTDDCPTCMQMMPIVESLAHRYEGLVHFIKVDAHQAQDLVRKFHVPKVPSILIFKDGALVARYNQAMTKSELIDAISLYAVNQQASTTHS